MKIRCDVCEKDAASVFCTADEAALCSACDHRVHDANKLASKHHRLSLLHPSSSKESPLCDVCQDKAAFLFCQQDRAILCTDCDVSIHSANDHTKNHNRFLLTGVKLSSLSNPSLSSSSSVSLTTSNDESSVPLSKSPITKPKPSNGKTQINENNLLLNKTTTTIKEYLTEMLPGWHVEDFLESSPSPFGFCKHDEIVPPSYLDANVEWNRTKGSFQQENMGLWVPQAPNYLPSQDSAGLIGIMKESSAPNLKLGHSNKRLIDDGGYAVPQISPPSLAAKRSRSFW